MTGFVKLNSVRIVTIRTSEYRYTVFGTSCGSCILHVIVAVTNGGDGLVAVMATYAKLEYISIGKTIAIYNSFLNVMSVKIASLLGSQSCNGIVREVVSLESNKAVIVSSLDRLKLTLIIYEPNCDTVNVLAILQSIRKSYSNEVAFSKLRNVSVTVADSKVVNRVVTNLSKLFGINVKVCKIIVCCNICRNCNLLISDRINNTVIKLDVSVIELNFLILKIAGIGSIGDITGVNRNGLCFATILTGVNTFTVLNRALVPYVTGCICFYCFGLGIRALGTDECFFSGCGTGRGSCNACNVSMLGNRIALYLFFAFIVSTDEYFFIFTYAKHTPGGSNPLFAMPERSADGFSIRIGTSRTLICVYCSGSTGAGVVVFT